MSTVEDRNKDPKERMNIKIVIKVQSSHFLTQASSKQNNLGLVPHCPM